MKEKLDYIKDLGVDSIWLSPVYQSGGVDFGNDIIDHKGPSIYHYLLRLFQKFTI